MELTELLDKFKEQRAADLEYVDKELEKGFLVSDSVLYRSVHNADSVCRGMRKEYHDNMDPLMQTNSVKNGIFDEYTESVTVRTDRVYLTKVPFTKKGKEYPLYEGFINISENKKKPQFVYVRCYSEPWHGETTYDIMAVQVGENEFYSGRISCSAGKIVTPEIEKEFFEKVQEIFEAEMSKRIEQEQERDM